MNNNLVLEYKNIYDGKRVTLKKGVLTNELGVRLDGFEQIQLKGYHLDNITLELIGNDKKTTNTYIDYIRNQLIFKYNKNNEIDHYEFDLYCKYTKTHYLPDTMKCVGGLFTVFFQLNPESTQYVYLTDPN